MRRTATRTLLAATAGAGLLAAGCSELGVRGRQTSGESVLELIAPPSPAEAARWAVDPNSADNRQQGILLLANAPWGGESVYLDLYRQALTDEDEAVRAAAVKAIGLHGGPEDAPALAGLLGARRGPDAEPELVRREAARALQRIHNPSVVSALIRATDPSGAAGEEDAEVRALAADALGQYRQSGVLQALIGALNDRRLVVNVAALRSLRTLTGRDFGYDVDRWLAWSRETSDYFADATPYIYPVYQRDKRLLEWIVPWLEPPNEVASTPAGMPLEADALRAEENAETPSG